MARFTVRQKVYGLDDDNYAKPLYIQAIHDDFIYSVSLNEDGSDNFKIESKYLMEQEPFKHNFNHYREFGYR